MFMWSDVIKKMISRCDACQRMNKMMTSTTPELHPVLVKSPWYHIGIDFVGPITSTSSSGNRYILTVSDCFTKWAEAIALPSKHAQGVAEALFKFFMRMGLPQVLITDQGLEFRNQLNEELMKHLGIKHRLTTAYHPQANGLDERYNQTLQNMLVKYVTKQREEWDQYVDTCVYAYNTSVQESTCFSPFEVMFGRKATIPIDIDTATKTREDHLQKCLDAEKLSPSKVEKMEFQQQELLQQVKANILQAQEKQKEYYDRKRTNPFAYTVSAKVLKKDFLRKKCKGCTISWAIYHH